MTTDEAIKYLRQLYPHGGHCWLDEQRIEAISMAVSAIDTLDAVRAWLWERREDTFRKMEDSHVTDGYRFAIEDVMEFIEGKLERK